MNGTDDDEKSVLTIRTTSTGVEVIGGHCPHCGHPAMDHWSDGCKGARGGADHCRMDPWKLKRLARPIPPTVTEETRPSAACRSCPPRRLCPDVADWHGGAVSGGVDG